MMPAEDNCAALVELPTEAEMNEAITGNMAHLMVVMKAVKRFKKLIYQKRPQFMDGLFGRESRLSAPPHQAHGQSLSVETSDRVALESALATEGVHRNMEEELITAPDLAKLAVDSPSSVHTPSDAVLESASASPSVLAQQQRSCSEENIERPHLYHKASTFPLDERGKGQAHDPLEDRIYLQIGAGADLDGIDENDFPIVCESPGGVDDDIYEAAYQEELNRILQAQETASVVLTRRVEHIERLRRHPNVLASSVNHAIDFAGTTASRVHARAKTSRFASFARETRDKARANVNERMDARATDRPSRPGHADIRQDSAPALLVNDEQAPSPSITPMPLSPGPSVSGVVTPPSRSRTPNSERRLRDAARVQAGHVLKGAARRLNEKASRLEPRSSIHPYPET